MILYNKQKTFTLVEMLIVIVIIGILAAALIPRLQSVQSRARDTKRKTDITTYNNAFAVFLADNGFYPISPPALFLSSTSTAPWVTGLTNILTSLPLDPINVGTPCYNPGVNCYGYFVDHTTSAAGIYSLMTILENNRDPDRCAVKGYKYNYLGNYNSRCGGFTGDIYDGSPFSLGN